jgi:succinate dehydrogenase / fumarate reductase cytochrome b subunit
VLQTVAGSSLGGKYLMALTGLGLIGFVLIHMLGNLQIFLGPEALNSYAHALKSKPALLWTARLGLLTIFVAHVFMGLRLTALNRAARPVRYVCEDTVQASWASRNMMLTGLVILAFIIYHLAHFTFGVVKPASIQSTPSGLAVLEPPRHYLDLVEIREAGSQIYVAQPSLEYRSLDHHKVDARHDVYSMVVAGFRNPIVALTYVLAQIFLALHLWHGGSSWFQSLGINHPSYQCCIRMVGPVLAVVVLLGNCSMPLAVLAGIVR